jgi:hypothetical protein
VSLEQFPEALFLVLPNHFSTEGRSPDHSREFPLGISDERFLEEFEEYFNELRFLVEHGKMQEGGSACLSLNGGVEVELRA